jgi:hypothetical protein
MIAQSDSNLAIPGGNQAATAVHPPTQTGGGYSFDEEVARLHEKIKRDRVEITSEQRAYLKKLDDEKKAKHADRNRLYRQIEENKNRDRDRHTRYMRNRRLNSPSIRLVGSLRARLNQALKENWKSGGLIDLLGCSIDDFKSHLERHFRTGMSWDTYGKNGWQIDHHMPISMFDLSTEIDQRICFHWTNLIPMWGWANLKKRDRLPSRPSQAMIDYFGWHHIWPAAYAEPKLTPPTPFDFYYAESGKKRERITLPKTQ